MSKGESIHLLRLSRAILGKLDNDSRVASAPYSQGIDRYSCAMASYVMLRFNRLELCVCQMISLACAVFDSKEEKYVSMQGDSRCVLTARKSQRKCRCLPRCL